MPRNVIAPPSRPADAQLPPPDELGGVPRVSLLPLFSRPLQLCRILPMVCQLGLDRIVLSNARKFPRDYFGSSLLRKPETLLGLLVEELTIFSDVSLQDVIVTGKLGAFLEDELDGRKWRQRLGGTRGIRQTAGDEHEDALL